MIEINDKSIDWSKPTLVVSKHYDTILLTTNVGKNTFSGIVLKLPNQNGNYAIGDKWNNVSNEDYKLYEDTFVIKNTYSKESNMKEFLIHKELMDLQSKDLMDKILHSPSINPDYNLLHKSKSDAVIFGKNDFGNNFGNHIYEPCPSVLAIRSFNWGNTGILSRVIGKSAFEKIITGCDSSVYVSKEDPNLTATLIPNDEIIKEVPKYSPKDFVNQFNPVSRVIDKNKKDVSENWSSIMKDNLEKQTPNIFKRAGWGHRKEWERKCNVGNSNYFASKLVYPLTPEECFKKPISCVTKTDTKIISRMILEDMSISYISIPIDSSAIINKLVEVYNIVKNIPSMYLPRVRKEEMLLRHQKNIHKLMREHMQDVGRKKRESEAKTTQALPLDELFELASKIKLTGNDPNKIFTEVITKEWQDKLDRECRIGYRAKKRKFEKDFKARVNFLAYQEDFMETVEKYGEVMVIPNYLIDMIDTFVDLKGGATYLNSMVGYYKIILNYLHSLYSEEEVDKLIEKILTKEVDNTLEAQKHPSKDITPNLAHMEQLIRNSSAEDKSTLLEMLSDIVDKQNKQ